MAECVSSIKLARIMDLETVPLVGVLDENGNYVPIAISLRSILMEITVPSLGKPLFLVIAYMGGGYSEGIVSTGRAREGEATKIVKHVASTIMYRLIFIIKTDPNDIAEFIQTRFSTDQVKVPMEHSAYKMETGMVTPHQSSNYHSDNAMRDIEREDCLNLSILDAESKLDLGNMNSGIIFDHDDGASMGLMTPKVYMNNNMVDSPNKNGDTVVNGFSATTKLISTPNTQMLVAAPTPQLWQ